MNNNLIEIIRRFQTHHALREERARTWVPAPSDFKVPNEADQTRNLMILGLKETNDQQSSQEQKGNLNMKTRFYWIALFTSAALIAQAQAGGYRGGGFAMAPHSAPAFHSAPHGNFGAGRFSAPGPRLSSYRPPMAFQQQQFSGSDRALARHFQNRAANPAQAHVFARRTASWHRDWDRHRDHFWNGHRCRFVNGEWFIYDTGFYPYDYYPYAYDPGMYDDGAANYSQGAYDSTDQTTDSTVAGAQTQLARQGYYRGEIDGIVGPETRRAIMRYQRDRGLRVTGNLNVDTLHALESPRVGSN